MTLSMTGGRWRAHQRNQVATKEPAPRRHFHFLEYPCAHSSLDYSSAATPANTLATTCQATSVIHGPAQAWALLLGAPA